MLLAVSVLCISGQFREYRLEAISKYAVRLLLNGFNRCKGDVATVALSLLELLE